MRKLLCGVALAAGFTLTAQAAAAQEAAALPAPVLAAETAAALAPEAVVTDSTALERQHPL
jgi:hypothetical protein